MPYQAPVCLVPYRSFLLSKLLLGVLLIVALSSVPTASAEVPSGQTSRQWHERASVGLLAGLLQPLATDGYNIQLDARYRRFVFDYSHGWSLDLPVVGEAERQGLGIHLPYSTGMGLGYKLTKAWDLRFEPKLHKFEIHQDGRDVARYRTVTLGAGAYYTYRPFEHSHNAARGITMAASVRYWRNVWSELGSDGVAYVSSKTGAQEVHETSNIGIANTPWILNVSVGYVFDL